MTLLNFPPTNGQPTDGSFTYVANGVIYAWDGEKWTANTEQSFEDTYVNIDGDTMTGNLTVPSLNGGPLAGFRNQIINGDFRVWQRGTTFTNGNSNYTADRWMCTAGPSVSVKRSVDAPSGFAWSVELDSVASGGFQQGVELTRSNNNDIFAVGSTWTLSLWSTVDMTGATPAFRFRKSVGVGDDQVIAVSSAPAWERVDASAAADNGFHQYKSTVTIDGDASTVKAGEKVVCLMVSLTGGTAVGACKITGVQFEPGPVATPFEHRPIGTELALCQRYYLNLNHVNNRYPVTQSSDSTSLIFVVDTPVPMRANPQIIGTLDKIGVQTGSNFGSGNATASILILDAGRVLVNGGSGFTATTQACVGRVNGAFDAEL